MILLFNDFEWDGKFVGARVGNGAKPQKPACEVPIGGFGPGVTCWATVPAVPIS